MGDRDVRRNLLLEAILSSPQNHVDVVTVAGSFNGWSTDKHQALCTTTCGSDGTRCLYQERQLIRFPLADQSCFAGFVDADAAAQRLFVLLELVDAAQVRVIEL